MTSIKRFGIIVIFLGVTIGQVAAQAYHGITGLLQVPSAETDSAGTFHGGASFLDKRFTPAQLNRGGEKYNTMGYTIGITGFSWFEASYSAALLYMHRNGIKGEPLGYYNEDRHVNVKLRPLKEGRWWPAVAIGCDDVGRFKRSFETNANGNNYFQNVYIAATKHFEIGGNELGTHLAYRYYPSNANKERRGVAGGLTIRPSFYRPLRIVAEWDGVGVNAGADVLFWQQLFIQACLVHGQGFTGGIGYRYQIPF